MQYQNDLADLLWQRASEHLFCTKEQYLAALSKFEVSEIRQDGLLIGATLACGNEIHLEMKQGCQLTRRVLREHLGKVIQQYGHAVTRVPKHRKNEQAFVIRLGFKQTHEDDFDIHYKIERMHHA